MSFNFVVARFTLSLSSLNVDKRKLWILLPIFRVFGCVVLHGGAMGEV